MQSQLHFTHKATQMRQCIIIIRKGTNKIPNTFELENVDAHVQHARNNWKLVSQTNPAQGRMIERENQAKIASRLVPFFLSMCACECVHVMQQRKKSKSKRKRNRVQAFWFDFLCLIFFLYITHIAPFFLHNWTTHRNDSIKHSQLADVKSLERNAKQMWLSDTKCIKYSYFVERMN